MDEIRLRIAPLICALRHPEEIVRIETARTLRELVGARAADLLSPNRSRARDLLEDPAIIGDLWMRPGTEPLS